MGKLRAVTDDDAPPAPVEPMTLKTATEKSERQLLVTMRAKIASEIDCGVPPHTLAPLSRQLLDIDKQIRQIDVRASQESDAHANGAVDDTFDSAAI
jgi:hypothetical protein